MTSQTDTHSVDATVRFQTAGQPLRLHMKALTLRHTEDAAVECRLLLSLTPAQFQRVDSEALFHFSPDVRAPKALRRFDDTPIELEIKLLPSLLPDLAKGMSTAAAAAERLIKWSQALGEHPLLAERNWLALTAYPAGGDPAQGYRTFWTYFDPTQGGPEAILDEGAGEAMLQFMQDRGDLDAIPPAMHQKLVDLALGFLRNQLTTPAASPVDNGALTDQALGLVTDLLNGIATDVQAESTLSPALPITLVMRRYFDENDWRYEESDSGTLLALGFRGENGAWPCYALARDEQAQVVFYSICPLNVPAQKLPQVAELLTRLNYGLVIGNFEMDWEDGEVRYRTSVDVENTQADLALIHNLVYANVTTMDQCLPMLQQVVESDLSPKQAIETFNP